MSNTTENVAGNDGKTPEQLIAEAQERSRDPEHLTGQERLLLEQAQAARAQAEQRKAELELQQAQLHAQNTALKFQQNLQSHLDESGCDFYVSPEQLLKLLDGGPESGNLKLEMGADGRVCAFRDGTQLPVKEALRQYGLDHTYLVKNSTELRLADAQSKSDLLTNEEKSAYISRHGLQKFEALPAQRIERIDVGTITKSEWDKLRPSQKVKLIDAGADVGAIMRRR